MAIKRIPKPMYFEGLNADAKPTTGVLILSEFMETDTGDVYTYVYTADNDGTKEWVRTFNNS